MQPSPFHPLWLTSSSPHCLYIYSLLDPSVFRLHFLVLFIFIVTMVVVIGDVCFLFPTTMSLNHRPLFSSVSPMVPIATFQGVYEQ